MSPQRNQPTHGAQTSSSSSRRGGATRARGANGSACDQCRKRKIRVSSVPLQPAKLLIFCCEQHADDFCDSVLVKHLLVHDVRG